MKKEKKTLVIVESPTKAKTLKKFLGKSFSIEASFGHIRDLPENRMGVKIDGKNFIPEYVFTKESKKIAENLKREAKKSDLIILASDPDREGESIAWHIAEVLKDKEKIKRATFHEITKSAVLESLKNLGEINQNLVEAQKARRILDRLVGYSLSPLLWSKIFRGISAGRVQSVALRLICEREEEIKSFEPTYWWELDAFFEKDGKEFLASYIQKTAEDARLKTEEDARKLLEKIDGKEFLVSEEKLFEIKKTSPEPFKTSTLQQSASSLLGFSPKKTMTLAQRLYEGINGLSGLITYHRTDSLNLSNEFLSKTRDFIRENFGKEYLPKSARIFKTKSKLAQEAHEAIRPTNVNLSPDKIKTKIPKDELKLYELIWSRSVASQMSDAKISKKELLLEVEGEKFKANGQKVIFDGFTKVYKTQISENEITEIKKGEKLLPKKLEISKHETSPPPRYNEASLIKTLEELGIGRPSTYSTIVSVIVERKYVELIEKKFFPTEIGMLVNQFLVEHFPEIVDYNFTAKLEDDLDEISTGEKECNSVLFDFYEPFKKKLDEKKESLKKVFEEEKTEKICEKCGGKMVIKQSRFGKFLACSNYPNCKNTVDLPEEKLEEKENQKERRILEEICPKCGSKLEEKFSVKFKRKFIGCSNYPSCNYIKKEEPKKTDKTCPKCGGKLLERKSRFGIFFGCENYPKCKFIEKKSEN